MPSLTRIRYEQKLQFFLDRNSDTELTIISRRESSGWGVSLFDFRTLRTEFCSDLRKQRSLKGYKRYTGFSRSLKAPRITYNPWKVIFLHGIRLRAGSYFSLQSYSTRNPCTRAAKPPQRVYCNVVVCFRASWEKNWSPDFNRKCGLQAVYHGMFNVFSRWDVADWEQRYVVYFPQYSFFLALARSCTNKCKNNRYILQQVTWVQYDSIVKWSSKVQNLFKLLKLNRKKSKAEIFRNFRNVNKKPKEISATFAESSDAFVSFLSFYFSFSCWSGSSRVKSFFFM